MDDSEDATSPSDPESAGSAKPKTKFSQLSNENLASLATLSFQLAQKQREAAATAAKMGATAIHERLARACPPSATLAERDVVRAVFKAMEEAFAAGAEPGKVLQDAAAGKPISFRYDPCAPKATPAMRAACRQICEELGLAAIRAERQAEAQDLDESCAPAAQPELKTPTPRL